MSTTVESVLVVALIAVLAPWIVFRIRLRLPVAVLEIILGIAFGRSGLGLIHKTSILGFLSLFGLSYIMFLSGLEMDLDRIFGGKPGRDSVKSTHLIRVALVWMAIGLGIGAILSLTGWIKDGWAVGILLASSAPTVLLPTLKELGLLDEPFGQRILTLGLIVDFVSLLSVTVLASTSTPGHHFRLLLVLLLFIPVVLVWRTSRWLRSLWFGIGAESVTGQIGVRGALAIITLFIALAQTLGTITVLGAFLSGAVVSAIIGSEHEVLEHKLDAIGFGYFIPFFFVTMGSTLNIAQLGSSPVVWGLIGIFLVSVGLVSILSTGFLGRGLFHDKAFTAGLLLSTRLSVTVAGSAILYGAHLIAGSVYLAMIVMSVLSSVIFPPLFGRRAPKPSVRRQEVLLIGPDRFVIPLQKRLTESGGTVSVVNHVDHLKSEAAALRQSVGTAVVLSDSRKPRLEWAYRVETLINPDRIIVEVDLDERNTALAKGYVPFVATLATVEFLQSLILLPHSTEFLLASDVPLQEFRVENASVINVRLRDLGLPEDTLILSITRRREQILPRGSTVLRMGDIVTVWCPTGRSLDLRPIFEKD